MELSKVELKRQFHPIYDTPLDLFLHLVTENRGQLVEAWLALTMVKYHDNL